MRRGIINNTVIRIATAIFLVAVAIPAYAQTPSNEAVSTDTSANWAGYAASGDSYSGLQGTWTIPTPVANGSTGIAADATWVGIGGISSKDLIQTGTEAIVQNGAITYEAWYETLPQGQQSIPITVNGGDSITASITETSSNVWQISFTDNTTGKQYQTAINYTSSHSSAEWIEEMPVGVAGRMQGFLPLDNFGSVQFSNAYASADGVQKNIVDLGAQEMTMIANRNQSLATPSAIGSDDASFSVTRSSVAMIEPQSTQNTKGWRRNGVGIHGFTPSSRHERNSSVRHVVMPFSFRQSGNRLRMEFLFRR